MARIDNHKYTIEEAFRECFYVVPDYQREYVWTDKEVHQLLDDINEQLDAHSDTDYFVGTVLVSPRTEKGHFDVIDGQQRLTTFFLLLCALRNQFEGQPQSQSIASLISTTFTTKDGNVSKSLKLDPRYENASELMAKVVELNEKPDTTRNSITTSGIKPFGSLDNLLNAYATIHQYLTDNYKDLTELRKFWGYLATNVVFIQISTDVSSALKIFETINERGVGLNSMDLLKNLLFTNVKPNEFPKLKIEWRKITGPLEKEKEKPLRFLRYFLMANYRIANRRSEKDKNDPVVREDEIYAWFVQKENRALCQYEEKPFEFVRKITRNVEHYLAFARGDGNDGKPNTAMANLKLLAGAAFSLHYVLLLAAAPLPKELFDHFVLQLESFLFYYIFTKSPTKDLEKSFSLWADELREIAAIQDANAQKAALNKFVADHFQAGMEAKQVELEDALRRYTLYAMQKYRTRYLLSKLTQTVDHAYKGLKTVESLEVYKGLEIEHILPDTPTDALLASFAAQNGDAKYHEYKNRLGNLTLLEKPINIVASNDFFEKKLAEYKKSKHYLTSSIAELAIVGKNSSINRINEHLKAYTTWDAASITERQGKLIGLAKEIWRTNPIPVEAGV